MVRAGMSVDAKPHMTKNCNGSAIVGTERTNATKTEKAQSTMTNFIYLTDDYDIMRYDTDALPAITLTQGQCTPDETIYDVIKAIAEVAHLGGENNTASRARSLAQDVFDLHNTDRPEVQSWGDVADEEGVTQDILTEAQNLDGITVDWDGDAGTVTVSLSAGWNICPPEEVPEELK